MINEHVEYANQMICQDEERIKHRYGTLGGVWYSLGAVTPIFVVAYFEDTKWTVAVGLATIAIALIGQDARNFDIATRIARTNTFLRDLMIIQTERR